MYKQCCTAGALGRIYSGKCRLSCIFLICLLCVSLLVSMVMSVLVFIIL